MLLPARVPSPFVVALIATRDRPALLQRALASVGTQTRPPDALIVVEDGPELSAELRRLVATVSLPGDLILLHNRRTPGASGAWNSGLDEAARRFAPAHAVYIAILDDDDWWEPEHVERCLTTAVAREADMVAPSIVRHDDAHPEGRIQDPPNAICADLALTRNPHIQGSNLFVRLSTLLEAGAFDEALRSTTDRDLLVRLADLGASYAPVVAATVHHDARGERPRLSTAGSEAKSEGLARFWSKYRLRMNDEQREAFLRRARTLFAADIESIVPQSAVSPPAARGRRVTPESTSEAPLVLVVGVTADGDERGTARVTPLLEDLLALQSDDRVAALDVVLVENGSGGSALRDKVAGLIRRGLRCYLADPARQREDAASGFFGPEFVRREGRMGISEAREVTQKYVRRLMRPGAVAWILDDDKRLEPLVHDSGRLERRSSDVVGTIMTLRRSGADVVLGVDTGAAPLPAAATLRTQLVDLAANVAAMRVLGPDAVWPDRSAENLAHARSAPDYYYDLARFHTWHLELPFWFHAGADRALVRDAFSQLCSRAPRILGGEQVFRPLIADRAVELTLRPSIRRGGSTLVFTADALVDVPQVVPAADGRPTRRSDMVWALLNTQVRGRRVEEAPFAVFHDRSDLDERDFDIRTLVDDIRGYALYSTLRDLAERSPQLDALDDRSVLFARQRYQKYLAERVAAFVLSFHRARGAARTVRAFATAPDAWWRPDHHAREDATGLASFADRVLALLEPRLVERVQTEIADTPQLDVANYMRSLGTKIDAASVPIGIKPEWIRRERARLAQAQVERLANPAGPVKLLGVGHEGVVFTDGREVFKYLDLWRARASEESRTFLRGIVGAWSDTEGLYPLQRFIERGPHVVLTYPYEPSEPYTGGRAAGIVRLLRECREHGIAFRNMHPRNLRVAGDRVRLVDYGADLVPLDEQEWRHMVRRAWLCWRWAHLPNLEDLMRRALRADVPELTGWERLERAVLAVDAKKQADALVLAKVLEMAPRSVLDYGCGAGKMVLELARQEIRALGFDPRGSQHWRDRAGADFTTDRDRALAGAPYDVVACALVLCTLDDAEYPVALADLRATVRDGGRVVVAVCNPLHTHGGETPFQDRLVPGGSDADRTFEWSKRVRSTGAVRRDVHRPLHVLKRDLLRAGLLVDDVAEVETVDLARLEPASDFMLLTARPIAPGPKVSLLVRASALEWRTLSVQVRHVVEQLESPTAFHERIVVLDSRRESFVRQYEEADLDAARAVLANLVEEGTIDRVVEVPSESTVVEALNERWFGLAASDTHTTTGTPVAATLIGIEACTGDYVLHIDDDLLVFRLDREHRYLDAMVDGLERDAEAICASLNICHDEDQPWTAGGTAGAWRVEVRGTLLHRDRLLASRPWPNELRGSTLVRSWYRALDERIRIGGLRSLRGGRAETFFVHPPNERKQDRDAWLAVLDRVENGVVAASQRGHVDLRGDLDDWLSPKREEDVIVIACGRNVPAGRVARFRDSLLAQSLRDFGLVVVEDGGSRTSAEIVRHAFGGWAAATVLTLRERRGGLANIVWALRHVCRDPRSIIVLVDLDDALLGSAALERVAAEFARGADLTVGGMLRTDKARTYPVDFDCPRKNRGGNIWQHLRAFRRALFDEVPDDALRLDGEYVDLAWDWALMLPLVERARAPRYISDTLYLYEPSGVGKTEEERCVREENIGRIVAKPSMRRGEPS